MATLAGTGRRGFTVIAHRFGYALAYGVDALLAVEVVAHACDPLCHRPAHWRKSTHGQNRREWAARRHQLSGPLRDLRGARGRAVAIRAAVRSGAPLAAVLAAGVAPGEPRPGWPTVPEVWIPQLPGRLRWSHNSCYHRWLLRQLPSQLDRALDVGCGRGRLACTLASRTRQVDAVDASAAMIAAAQRRCPDSPRVRWLVGDVLDRGLLVAEGGYDAVTAVSSLHHLPLEDGLDRLAELVRPGGVLAVVGHYRPATIADRCLELIALPANAAVGAALAMTRGGGKPDDDGMPVQPPTATLAEVRQAAARLPGSTVTRALYWRYLLTWRREPDR